MSRICPNCRRGPVSPILSDCPHCGHALGGRPKARESVVHYGCSRCGRRSQGRLSAVVRAIQKSPQCQTCGGPLALPPEVQRALDDGVHADVERVMQVDCPVCRRRARVKGAGPRPEVRCTFCQFRFWMTPQGPGFGPLANQDLSPYAARVGSLEPLAATLLRARDARGELSAQECTELALAFEGLEYWPQMSQEVPRLPFTPGISIDFLQHMVVTATGARRRADEQVTFVYSDDRRDGAPVPTEEIASDLAALAVLAAVGGGLRISVASAAPEAVRTSSATYVRVQPGYRDGWSTLGCATWVDDAPPAPLPPAYMRWLADALRARARSARAYLYARAAFGPGAASSSVLLIQPSAMEAHLTNTLGTSADVGRAVAAHFAQLSPRLPLGIAPGDR